MSPLLKPLGASYKSYGECGSLLLYTVDPHLVVLGYAKSSICIIKGEALTFQCNTYYKSNDYYPKIDNQGVRICESPLYYSVCLACSYCLQKFP